MDQSIVSQREINVDTESYVTALRASLLTAETALAYATCARSSPVPAGFWNYAHHEHTKKGPPDLFVVCLATKK